MKVLLSDEQIREVISHTRIGEYDYKLLCAAQLKAVIEWLESPCTEHVDKVISKDDPVIGWAIDNDITRHYAHRRDCPECWENLKGEAGVTGTTKPKPRS